MLVLSKDIHMDNEPIKFTCPEYTGTNPPRVAFRAFGSFNYGDYHNGAYSESTDVSGEYMVFISEYDYQPKDGDHIMLMLSGDGYDPNVDPAPIPPSPMTAPITPNLDGIFSNEVEIILSYAPIDGDKGETGEAGPPGNSGSTGGDGFSGPSINGWDGDNGADGDKGEPGGAVW